MVKRFGNVSGSTAVSCIFLSSLAILKKLIFNFFKFFKAGKSPKDIVGKEAFP